MATNTACLRSLFGGVALGIALGAAPQAAAESTPAAMTLSEADQTAVLKAAGAIQRKGVWVICVDEPSGGGASIELVRDLNGDGRPEAVVTEGGMYCHGHSGTGYTLLSKQAGGKWRVMSSNNGIPEFLKTRGVGGWPDISIGGPGFCFPVQRWNGKTYALNRFEYEGKRCKPPR